MKKPSKEEILRWIKQCEEEAKRYRDHAHDAGLTGNKERVKFWNDSAATRDREAADLRKFMEAL